MTLPALPMGTIMATCMLIGALAVAAAPARPGGAAARGTPRAVRVALVALGAVLLAAGLWQLGWYFPRHPAERWGLAALASGLLLLAGGAWCASARARAARPAARWPLAIGLGALALVYGVTIARL